MLPMVYLRYPANIPHTPGHSWADGVAEATPIAHKGSTAGAKVQALTALDFLLSPELVKRAWDYFKNVQTKDVKYTPLDWCGRQACYRVQPAEDGEVSA